MGRPSEAGPVPSDYLSLETADNRLLIPFTTTGWAGMSVLLVDTPEGRQQYPHLTDALGHFPNCAQNHPLRKIEYALGGKLDAGGQPLQSLAYQVGQIAQLTRTEKPQKWERKALSELYIQVGEGELTEPRRGWRQADFVDYYKEIRALQSRALCTEVALLAGAVAVQNERWQLYVEKQSSGGGNGWLAPLVSLVVDVRHTNDYDSQVHDVVPVVRQNNEQLALLWGADGAIFTASVSGSA